MEKKYARLESAINHSLSCLIQKIRQGLNERLHEINAFLYIHIPVSTLISLLYVNEYVHVYLYVYTSSYCHCMYILISQKWEYVVVVYCVSISVCISARPQVSKIECIGMVCCVSISVCIFVGTVPRSPSLQKWECIGMVYYVYICRYYPHVPKSPKMRMYMRVKSKKSGLRYCVCVYGWYIVSLSPYVYPCVLSSHPQVSKNDSV